VNRSKCIFLLVSLLGLHNIIKCQDLNDKVFNNVIKIQESNVAKIGEYYITDIPIVLDSKMIFLNEAYIPNGLFFKPQFYSDLEEFILISPDEEYYRKVADGAQAAGINCPEPMPSFKYYHLKRNGSYVSIDSITIRGNNQPKLNFKKAKAKKTNYLQVYYSENTGSSCCPADTISEKVPLRKYITDFEKDHAVNIGCVYGETWGDEGESTTYFSLKQLTLLQRLEFIINRLHVRYAAMNIESLLIIPPAIFMPFYKEKTKFLRSNCE
jgi:hypothetical protein